jgi:hypothetical protein
MKMKNHLKFLLSLLVIASLVFACGKKSDTDNQTTQQTEPEKKDQYRMSEMFSGDKAQIIDLIEGPATFEIEHEGTSAFTVRLLNPDGTQVELLADVTGNYRGTKSITVPKTSSYILDVKTEGRWSVYRK